MSVISVSKTTTNQENKKLNEGEYRNMSNESKEIMQAPTFGLDKWRKEHGLINPAMEAYIEACREQKTLLVIGVLLITIIVNYLRYGVP